MSDPQVEARGRGSVLRGADFLSGLVLLVIVVLSCLQVFMRFVLDAPLSWPEELSTLLLVWAVFLGSAVAVAREGHLRVDFVISRLSPTGARVVRSFAQLCVLAVAIAMCWSGWQFFKSTTGDTSTSLGYGRNLYYLPIALSGAAMVAASVINLARLWTSRLATTAEGVSYQ